MHADTKRELIEASSGALATLAKEMLVHRNEMRTLEQQKEMELELAEARQQSSAGQPAQGGQQTQAQSAPDEQAHAAVGVEQADLTDAFEDLREREQCGVCRTLLDAIERADRRTQVKALTEYGKLQHAVATGGTEDEIKAILQSSDTLEDLLEQEMGSA